MVSIGFYGKQLALFLVLGALAGGGLWYVHSQTTEASPKHRPIPSTSIASLQIQIQDGGAAIINGQVFNGLVDFRSDRDVFQYQAYHEDGSFVDQLTTTVMLPRSIDPIDPKVVVARQTVTYGGVSEDPVVTKTGATYVVHNLTPNASYRIELNLPKGTVEPSLLGRGIDTIKNLPAPVWVSVAIGLPLLALVVLGAMMNHALRAWRGPTITDERDTPPFDSPSTSLGVNAQGKPAPISPALVAILVHGKVSPRALAATLLNLAQRGFIQVVHRADGFSFGKKKPLDVQAAAQQPGNTPNAFEVILLDKLFNDDAIKSTNADIQLRIGRHIFSRKIAEAYLAMYDAAVVQGWFVANPQGIYRGYRSLALMVTAAAVLGFLISLIFGPEPYFYLFGWAGLFFVGLVMYQITPFLPRRTREGDAQYREWRKFANYLASPKPIRNVAKAQTVYQQYLPYAVAFGVEVEWTERFVATPFHTPDWYSTTEEIHVIEDFANNLFPIIGTVASEFARAREPNAV